MQDIFPNIIDVATNKRENTQNKKLLSGNDEVLDILKLDIFMIREN